MLDYTGLQALAAVVREGSFERAARRLHITPSAVSQRIKQLEERTGQVLVLRGTPCTGTDAGRRLCLHVEQVALLENELRRTNPGLMPDGHATPPTLKLAVNADSLSTWFMDAMAAFTAGGNELLDIASTTRTTRPSASRKATCWPPSRPARAALRAAIPGRWGRCATWPRPAPRLWRGILRTGSVRKPLAAPP
jgi:DNA-binding transcriptional LysR family regulator